MIWMTEIGHRQIIAANTENVIRKKSNNKGEREWK
jgi:hypothetical protein